MKVKTVFFGDSITWGYGTKIRWPKLLSKNLNLQEINTSIPGTVLQSTEHLHNNGQDRIFSDILHFSPRLVCILYGSNDMRFNNENFTNLSYEMALEDVVEKIYSYAYDPIEVIIGSPPYMNPTVFDLYSPYDNGSIEKQRQYTKITQRVASKFQCGWADVYGAMLNGGDNKLIGSDSFHPSTNGHRLIEKAFSKAILT